MAALDFPASPTVGQTFAAGNGVVYTWSGTVWLAGTSQSVLALYSETVLASPAGEIIVTVPTACKVFEVSYEISSVSGANVGIFLQCMQGGTPYGTANHLIQSVLGFNTTAGASVSGAATSWPLGNAIAWTGSLKGSLAPSATSSMFFSGLTNSIQSGNRVAQASEFDGGPPRNTVTGFRFSSGSSFATGSTVRVLVVT